MSYVRLDRKGVPIRGRSRRQPAFRRIADRLHYHYQIRYDLPAHGGPRRQRMKRAWLTSDAEAETLAARLRGYIPSGLRWTEACQLFDEAYAFKRTEDHLRNMARDVQRLVEFLGDMPLEQTTLADYTRFLAFRERTTSGRAAQLARDHTRRIAKWAQSRGLVGELELLRAGRPEYKAKRRRPATTEEFRALAEVLPPHALPLWLAIGYTGCRITGMTRLREADISEDYITVTTKGGKVVSYLLLPPLRHALELARAARAKFGRGSDWLFLNSHGSRWNHTTFYAALKATWKKHPEAPRITPHQLRHMWGTLAASRNFSPDMIQAVLGHDDRSSAERYIDHTQEMADRVAREVITFVAPEVQDPHPDPGITRQVPAGPGTFTQCPKCGCKFQAENNAGQKP